MNERIEDTRQPSFEEELNDLIARKMAENKLLHKLKDALIGETGGEPVDPADETTETEPDKSINEY